MSSILTFTQCDSYDPATGHQCSLADGHERLDISHECTGLDLAVSSVEPTHHPHRWLLP